MKEKREKNKNSQVENNKEVGEDTGTSNKTLTRIGCIIVFVCSFLLYANTLNHGYVLDDYAVIKDNQMTKKGLAAIPEFFKTGLHSGNYNGKSNIYRPLAKTFFAAEWQIAPDDPSFAHGVNVVMYSFLCAFLFLILLRLLQGRLLLCLIASLVFAAHPVHTEVVANIKSLDEIMSLLFMLSALWAAMTYTKSKKIGLLMISILCYLLALFTKENSVVFLGLLPLSLYFFSKSERKYSIIITACMLAATFIYLYIHLSVMGSIGAENVSVADNSLLASHSFVVQRMTAIYILGLYLKLLIFPHPLSSDYSFNTIPNITTFADVGFLISLVICLALIVYAIFNMNKKTILSYAILFFFISISVVSNIFFMIGTNMAERLVFVPSIGLCLAIAYLLVHFGKLEKEQKISWPVLLKKPAVIFILIPVVLLFSFKTYDRNKDWKSNETLFSQDVETVPNSAHMLWYHAAMLANTDRLKTLPDDQRTPSLQQARKELLASVAIFPRNPNSQELTGLIINQIASEEKDSATKKHEKKEGLLFLKQAVAINPNYTTAQENLGDAYFALGKYDSAEGPLVVALQQNPNSYGAINNLAGIAFYKKDFLKAITLYSKAVTLNPGFVNPIANISVCYYNLAKYDSAIYYDRKAIGIDPTFNLPYEILANSYKKLAVPDSAKKYEILAKQNNPGFKLE